jgi:hypothetical protein
MKCDRKQKENRHIQNFYWKIFLKAISFRIMLKYIFQINRNTETFMQDNIEMDIREIRWKNYELDRTLCS